MKKKVVTLKTGAMLTNSRGDTATWRRKLFQATTDSRGRVVHAKTGRPLHFKMTKRIPF